MDLTRFVLHAAAIALAGAVVGVGVVYLSLVFARDGLIGF